MAMMTMARMVMATATATVMVMVTAMAMGTATAIAMATAIVTLFWLGGHTHLVLSTYIHNSILHLTSGFNSIFLKNGLFEAHCSSSFPAALPKTTTLKHNQH